MEFAIVSQFSYELTHNSYRTPLNTMEINLNTFFEKKTYGEKIHKVYLNFICVSQEFDQFFVVRPPKLLRKEPALTVEFKLKFDTYKIMKNADRYKYVLEGLYEVVVSFFETKKIKNFDQDSFVEDLKTFLNDPLNYSV